MSTLYKGPSIDATYQVSVHLAEGFPRRRLKCEKLTDDRHHMMVKAHIAFGKVSSKWPQAFLVLDWSISKKSSSPKLLCQNEPIFGGKHPWKVLYYVSSKPNER
jgi:hypothetical protein